MKLIIIVIVAMLFLGCTDEMDLGNNYFYLPEYEAYDIGFPYGSIVYKSKKAFDFDSILVYADVVAIKTNKEFIIVKQKPNKKVFKKYVLDQIKGKLLNGDRKALEITLLNSSISFAKKTLRQDTASLDAFMGYESKYLLFQKSEFIYYIINKKTGEIQSFFSEKVFSDKLVDYGIDLQF